MIKLEKTATYGWEEAIRGMRNPMNSWEKMDSFECVEDVPVFDECNGCPLNHGEEPHNYCIRNYIGATHVIGPNDHELMMKLRKAGTDHRKFMRMITVYVDITAPFYWWKEFDTYKVGTVANSCSTMHKIHAKEFTIEDFSTDHLTGTSIAVLKGLIEYLNQMRNVFISEKIQDKKYWWQMIQLLPTSYNQKRTIMLNYEVLANIYKSRKAHKLDEWRELCAWIEKLPYSELIIGEEVTE